MRVDFLLFAALLLSAELPSQEKSDLKFKARVDLVSLDAEVLDRHGIPVPNLTRQDFVVRENGENKEISHFLSLSDRLVSLAIVLDMSGFPRAEMVIAKQFISRLIHLLAREDEICLFTFDDRDAILEQDFTRDRTSLTEALSNIDVALGRKGAVLKSLFGKTPRTALGVDLALQKLRDAKNPKKTLLVVSNRFAGLGPGTLDHALESGCTVMTLGFKNKTSAWISLGGDTMGKNRLVGSSGGRNFSANTEDISGVCRSIVYALKNHYNLAYLTNVDPSRDKARKIEITIPGKEYDIYYRRSYSVSR